jgi:hypothetical protein
MFFIHLGSEEQNVDASQWFLFIRSMNLLFFNYSLYTKTNEFIQNLVKSFVSFVGMNFKIAMVNPCIYNPFSFDGVTKHQA